MVWNEPVGWIDMAQRLVVGRDWSVLFAGCCPGVRVETCKDAGCGFVRGTVLAKQVDAGEGKNCGECKRESYGRNVFDFERCEGKRYGKTENGGEDGKETPWKLEEEQFGKVLPDGFGDRCEQKCNDDGEGGEQEEESGWGACFSFFWRWR